VNLIPLLGSPRALEDVPFDVLLPYEEDAKLETK
jgi:hypothetical protein